MPKWITTKEAAAIMDVTERYVRMKVKDGELTGRRWGRDWQVEEKAARKFQRERRRKSPKS